MEETLEEKLVITCALACLYVKDLGMDINELITIDRLIQLDLLADSLVPDEKDAISITRELFRKYSSEVLGEARGREC